MEVFSALLALCTGISPVTCEFPSQSPVTQDCDVSISQRLNKQLSKQPRWRWFDTPSRSLWRHCNEPVPDVWFVCVARYMVGEFNESQTKVGDKRNIMAATMKMIWEGNCK